MKRLVLSGVVLAFTVAAPARAAPGLGEEVYGAQVQKGLTELELRAGRLGGGSADGEDAVVIEAAHGVTDRLRLSVLGEFEREPGGRHEAEAVGLEAIYQLTRGSPVEVAVYGEYEIGLDGRSDGIESKLLLQYANWPWDVRFNLIAEKPLVHSAKVELGYAALASRHVAGPLSLGVEAFGEAGTFDRLFPREEHFVGPVARFEFEAPSHEVELELGYLFALGEARDETDGQLRLVLEAEF